MTSGSIDRVSLGVGSQVALIKVRKHLHLDANVDVGLLDFDLSNDINTLVPVNGAFLPKVGISTTLADAIYFLMMIMMAIQTDSNLRETRFRLYC